MSVQTLTFEVETRGMTDVVDLTGQIAEKLDQCGLKDGTVTVFVPGSTAGITTIEYEPGMQQDLPIYFEKIAPYGGHYHHHETWDDNNGAAHFRAALLGPSLTVPFVNAHMTLGTWQQVVLVCFDTRPRRRKIILQILGE